MPTQVDALAIFKREVKNLARKYPAVIDVVNRFISVLETGSHPGARVKSLGKVVYKERLANPSASRGKSGGFRILYHVKSRDQVILIALYSKTERADITDAEIRQRVTAAESH